MKREKPDKGKPKSPPYSVTEFGTLLENMDKKIDQIAEGHVGLDKRLENVEVGIHGNSRRLEMVELRVGVVNDKVTRVEDAVSKLSKDLKDTRQELKSEIHDLGNRLTTVETRH